MVVPKKIRRYDFTFDAQSFKEMLIEHHEVWHEIAEITGVNVKTINGWAAPSGFDQQFPYPNMTNFIKVCNACDADPRKFFVLITDE